MNKRILIIPIFIILAFIALFMASSGCISDNINPNYTDVGKTYIVTELHLGHADGETFEIVMYKNGDTIQTLTNNNQERANDHQVQLNMYSTDANQSTLVYVKQ